ncbi:MAG TPA: aminoacetone oxidase family FAD-binding enzyme, partial [Longimicrobiales bacterium]|nr:aminoacetone oxidase family FAD-binding enzyme [Longimicrobiales bacterium]
MTISECDVAVIGAGAAGTMAAIFAAENGARVLLLERTKDGGRKILISGGGRCNVLPSEISPAQYFTASSRNSLKKILLSWPLADQKRYFEKDLRIPLALEEESGKLFPVSNKARDVRDALIERARNAGVRIQYNAYVTDLQPPDARRPTPDAGWTIKLDNKEHINARRLIIATGGLSVPATGSDGTGLRILQKLGHTINSLYPALTPLVCNPPRHGDLAGISLNVTLTAKSLQTNGGFLFTHRGYSGPSVLDISHVAIIGREPIEVQWTTRDARSWEDLFLNTTSTVGSLVRRELPVRLADALLHEAGVDAEVTTSQLRKDARARLVHALARYELPYTGDEGYKKAEVTGGGVALSEVDPRTLESRVHAGLFLCGEVL